MKMACTQWLQWYSINKGLQDGLTQQVIIKWFSPIAAMYMESRKPIGFIFPVMRKFFCNTHWVYQAYLFYGHIKPNKISLLVVNIKPTNNDELVPKSIQMH